jgi:hypothetical protein
MKQWARRIDLTQQIGRRPRRKDRKALTRMKRDNPKGLIRPPILRSGVEKERHATWLELLYDLVFVAAISQLAVIGETVVSIVMSVSAGHLKSLSAVTAIMGLTIVFTLWWGYFDGVKGADTRRLTSKNHVRAYQQWLYSHLPLTMAIASIAVGIKRVMMLSMWEMLSFQESWILSGSVGVCLLSLNTIFLSSYPGRPPDEALRFVRPQYALAFLTCVIGGLGTILSGIAILGILTA